MKTVQPRPSKLPSGEARVDLHIHTTFSDGGYTPAEVVELARRSGLPALAITDHDSIDGICPARQVAGQTLEVVSGVEITSVFQGRSLHLLGYFFDDNDSGLRQALEHLRRARRDRFWNMVARLDKAGIALDTGEIRNWPANQALGRRHLAELLVKAGKAKNVQEAFARYLHDAAESVVPVPGLPPSEAIAVVRKAGGVAALAHPTYDGTRALLTELCHQGLQAVEVDHPGLSRGRKRELRSWAGQLGLAVTGGSDCHGPGHWYRAIGTGSITGLELEGLRILGRKG